MYEETAAASRENRLATQSTAEREAATGSRAAPVKYRGVHHIALATNHMENTIRFYRDLLGFRLTAAMGEPGFRHYFFSIDGTSGVAFFEWPDVEHFPKKPHGAPVVGPFSFDHLSFGVESDDDLWRIRDRLEAAGFEVSEVIDHGICHSLYSFDPNDIPIEFAAPTGLAGSDLVIDDSHALPAAREGGEQQAGHWPEVRRPTPKNERVVRPGVGSHLSKR
ncbi:MAG TPA: VOC family protein [Candidatus Thermoplasmatota archaeon]